MAYTVFYNLNIVIIVLNYTWVMDVFPARYVQTGCGRPRKQEALDCIGLECYKDR
jgi:hypothetical protein